MKYVLRAVGAILGGLGLALVIFGCLAVFGYFTNEERDGFGILIIAWATVLYVIPGGGLLLGGRWLILSTAAPHQPDRDGAVAREG